MKYQVYMLTSPSGKKYIGFTGTSIEVRLRAHNRFAQTHSYPLAFAIRKYGIDAFKVRILRRFGRKNEALAYEVLSIARHKSDQKGIGYNVTPGGDGTIKPHATYGGDAWKLGKTQREIDAINAKKGRAGRANGFYGKRHSRRAKRKMVEVRRANGSYGKASGSFTLKYRNRRYESKRKLMESCGISRNALEKLINTGDIQILSYSTSSLVLSEQRTRQVRYRRKTYGSLAELGDHLGVSYKKARALLLNGDASYV